MHSLESIKQTIHSGEGQIIEFKTSFGEDVIITLKAFAYTLRGIVLIGVNNKGIIVGIQLNIEYIKTKSRWFSSSSENLYILKQAN